MLSGTSKQRASRHPPLPSVCDTAAAATIPAAAADDDDAPLTGGGGGKERRSSRHQPPPSTSDTAATTSATATAAAAPHSSDGGSVRVSASYRKKKRSPWSFHEEEQVPTTSTGLTTHWPALQLSITLMFCTRVLNRSLHQTPKSGFNPQRRLTLVSIKVKS